MNGVSIHEVERLLLQLGEMKKSFHDLMVLSTSNIDIEVNGMQFQLLMMLYHEPDINQKEIAIRKNITQATLSVRLSRLEKMGLIEKVLNGDDKRNFHIKLTKKGKDTVNMAKPEIENTLMKLVDGFSLAEINEMEQYLVRMVTNIKKIKEEE